MTLHNGPRNTACFQPPEEFRESQTNKQANRQHLRQTQMKMTLFSDPELGSLPKMHYLSERTSHLQGKDQLSVCVQRPEGDIPYSGLLDSGPQKVPQLCHGISKTIVHSEGNKEPQHRKTISALTNGPVQL